MLTVDKTKNEEERLGLLKKWDELNASQPGLRIRDAAEKLGLSEARLLSSKLGQGVRRLRCDPKQILPKLEGLGSLMALTRNDSAVHERHGNYVGVKIQGNVVLYNNPDIDLRIDLKHWFAAFAESKPHAGRELRSLQFFDASGTAIHKVYLDDDAYLGAYEALVQEFLHDDQDGLFTPEKTRDQIQPFYKKASGVQAGSKDKLLDAWAALEDTHHFGAMLSKQGLDRQEAFNLAEGRYTRRVRISAVGTLLNSAAASELPIMVFVGNPGCIQIHTGPVKNVKALDNWLNVFDPAFNLHLKTGGVAEAWVVTKPTKDGDVNSLELFAEDGSLVVQFFGKRKPGLPELAEWRTLLSALD